MWLNSLKMKYKKEIKAAGMLWPWWWRTWFIKLNRGWCERLWYREVLRLWWWGSPPRSIIMRYSPAGLHGCREAFGWHGLEVIQLKNPDLLYYINTPSAGRGPGPGGMHVHYVIRICIGTRGPRVWTHLPFSEVYLPINFKSTCSCQPTVPPVAEWVHSD